ncbi:hypothetical protein K8I28_05870 [bacterium]|nr:hypothetical protein [bacterium]
MPGHRIQYILQNRIVTGIVASSLLLLNLSAITCASENTSNNRFAISAGIDHAWTTHDDELSLDYQPDWLFEGHTGYFLSMSVDYKENVIFRDVTMALRLSYNSYKANFQYWNRMEVGKLNARVIRIDPFILHGKLKHTKISIEVNPIGFNFLSGTVSQDKNYYLYYPTEDYLFLVENIELEQNSMGFCLFGVGMYYEILEPNLKVGVETMLLQWDNPKVTFKTYGGDFVENSADLNVLFPFNLRLSYHF